jgi:glycosyltransferase involved in cell wall biosynthesis
VKSVCVDARLIDAPGIGTYLKNLFSQLSGTSWKWYALASDAARVSAWSYLEPILVSSDIYSAKEQAELSLKVPRTDLFWSPHYNVPCLPIRARKRLVTIHDAFHLAFASTLTLSERIYAKTMIRAALRLSDHVITDSEFSKKEIQHHIRSDTPMSVIHLGVDAVFSPVVGRQDRAVLEKYGIADPFLLYVGSFKQHKNLKGVIEAFSLLIQREWKWLKLVIVGGGSGKRHSVDVKQLCMGYPELQDRIHMAGWVPDDELPHFYRQAEMFVFPSFYEGFGLPPLEAMGSGCAAVVSRAGALPEVCAEGALYVDPHHPEQIADALEMLFKDKSRREELVAKGLARAKQFCWQRAAEAHRAIMETLIG